MTPAELITWAIEEIRGLDELCRSMVPGYMALDSDDIDKIKALESLAEELADEDD